jgi:hypothetical protein
MLAQQMLPKLGRECMKLREEGKSLAPIIDQKIETATGTTTVARPQTTEFLNQTVDHTIRMAKEHKVPQQEVSTLVGATVVGAGLTGTVNIQQIQPQQWSSSTQEVYAAVTNKVQSLATRLTPVSPFAQDYSGTANLARPTINVRPHMSEGTGHITIRDFRAKSKFNGGDADIASHSR